MDIVPEAVPHCEPCESGYHRAGSFVAAKCLMFIPALLIAEWYRRRNPRLISATLRGVIVMYLVVYAVGVIHVNRPVTAAELGEEFHRPPAVPAYALPPHPSRLAGGPGGL